MPLFARFTICVLLSFFWVQPCHAQPDTASFNKYYRQSIENLRALYMVRGASFTCTDISDPYTQVVDALKEYRGASRRLGLLFYSYNSDTLRTWMLRQGQLSAHIQRVPRETLVRAETDIRRALKVDLLLAARNAKNRGVTIKSKDTISRPDLTTSIQKATSILLPPALRPQLTGLSHLIIIPEFNISQFPLYLLQPFGNDSYLIDSMSISLAPHVCNLGHTVERYDHLVGRPNNLRPRNPVIIGNPHYLDSMDLDPLPGAEGEATDVASYLNTTPIIGSAATISAVKRTGTRSNFFYFATHGYADLEKGLAGSFLAFTPDSMHRTGLWNAKEIQNARFDAEASMAVLSACQTGVGQIYDAGFIGLGRAFYKAGIDHTIMSLWSVDDAATRKFMTGLVKTLTEDELYYYPASHLRCAILNFRKEDNNPAHWAPFMLFGFPF